MEAISTKFEQKFHEEQNQSAETKKNTTPSSQTSKLHKEIVDAEVQHLLKWAYNSKINKTLNL